MAENKAFELKIKQNRNYLKQVKLLRQWPQRMQKIQPQMAWLAADYIRRFVQQKLPKSGANKGYRNALEVVKVKGTRAGEHAYTVQLDSKNKDVRQVKVNRVLLYVHPSNRAKTPDPAVLILEKYNPWTIASLPFKPDKADAVVVTRRERPQKVFQTTQLRLRGRSQWAKELQKAGARAPSADKRVNFSKKMAILPDVALDALKMEFGLGRTKPRPAWRLAFKSLSKAGFKAFMKDSKFFAFPLTQPSFNLWKKWPQRTKHSITISQAKNFKAFQRKVAL